MLDPSIAHEIDGILAEPDIERKLTLAAELACARDRLPTTRDSSERLPPRRPARPACWTILPSLEVPERPDLTSERGRTLLVHAVAHIEISAVELALMAVADFPDQDPDYYRDMLRIAAEEVEHSRMLIQRLDELGGTLGMDPVHLGLWETAHRYPSLTDRLAVVPRILEAKGLDVSDRLRRKLAGVGDHQSAKALERVYLDEIGHVAIGTRWYRRVCRRQGLDPQQHFVAMAASFQSRRPVPFDVAGRRKAGFTDREMRAVLSPAQRDQYLPQKQQCRTTRSGPEHPV